MLSAQPTSPARSLSAFRGAFLFFVLFAPLQQTQLAVGGISWRLRMFRGQQTSSNMSNCNSVLCSASS